MKLRTSFFDKTVLRKDITRFAPLWAIYFIGGLLVMLNVADSTGNNGYYAASNVGETLPYFAIINLIYAGMAAQLLFGDLYNSRLCNALHAMPMRRENWFLTHVVSGLLYSIVPNFVGIFLVMFRMGDFWFVAFIWLLGMTLQYLFFFGLAVFSVFCTGNRFAMAAVYGILNGASMIAYWFALLVYQPLLYGVEIAFEPFVRLCPIAQIVSNDEMLVWTYELGLNGGHEAVRLYKYVGFGKGWGYLAIVAAIGVALLALSLVMYRRRRLECAGDFIAITRLEPVFCVVYTLCVGAVFAMFGELVNSNYMPYLIVGLLVGWFTGRMLLQRTVKVFSGKNFLHMGILTGVVLLSIGLTMLDPLGITRWTPKPEQVKSVTVSDNYNTFYNGSADGELTVTDPELIQSFIDVHKHIINTGESDENGDRSVRVVFTYTMKDGSEKTRSYFAWVDEDVYTALCRLHSNAAAYFPYGDWQTNPNRVSWVEIDGGKLEEQYHEGLFNAIIKDCEAGDLAYAHQYHDQDSWIKVFISITYACDDGTHDQREVPVYSDCRNTIAWLRANPQAWFTDGRYGDMTIGQVLGN